MRCKMGPTVHRFTCLRAGAGACAAFPSISSYSLFCFGWGAAEKGNGVVGWGEVAHPAVQSLLDGAGFGVLVLRLVGFQLIPRLLCDDFEDSLLVGWQRFSLVPRGFWIV